MIDLVTPALKHLPSYVRALQSGWIPNEMRAESGQRLWKKLRKERPISFIG
jgi:hypothetical protein